MEFKQYLDQVRPKFGHLENLNLESFKVLKHYGTKFSVISLAKLKLHSTVCFSEHITLEQIKRYSSECFNNALKNSPGMLRGMQNGVVSFSCLVSEEVDEDALLWVQNELEKHYAAFELPIIYDLKNDKLYFYGKTPVWGALYYKFFRNYIEKHFRP